MRRAIARGRVFPQSYSTDRRYGKLSLKACALFPLMWANADDQGRLSGEPDEIKYAVCPNIDHIGKVDIPSLLEELEQNNLIKLYNTPRSAAVQILDWWEVNLKMQWAWPSDYPPPDGWQDRLRYKRGAKEVVTFNWDSASPDTSPENSAETSPEQHLMFPLTTPKKENDKEEERRKRTRRGRGRGNSPERSGEKTSPAPTDLSTNELDILHILTECFKKEWGRVPAHSPNEVIPREPKAKESAQLRDLAKNLCSAGGVPLDYIGQAFREASSHEKFFVSYVRRILLDWLGVGDE